MKKTLALLTILTLSSSIAYADGMYNSVQVDKTRLQSTPKTLPSNLPEITEVEDLPDFSMPKANSNVYYNTSSANASQTAKIQDALLKIDSAQVDVKNELNLYESKLVDVKNRENLVKQEKNELMKEIRTVRKKMNALDSAKHKIVTNMDLQQSGKSSAPVHFNWFK
jgi:hypothetical protein